VAVRRVTLVEATLGSYVLMNRDGVPRTDLFLQKLDVPSPAVREVVEDDIGDGVDDRSEFVGARAVSVDLRLGDTPELIMGQLKPFCSPRRRPRLVVWDDAWAQERRLVLRGVSWPGEYDGVKDRLRDVQLQWTAPLGLWEAEALASVTIAAATGGGDGRTYDLITPRTYPATSVAGAAVVSNLGSEPTPFVARLYGPCIGPRLTEDATGRAVAFTPELVLGAGEYVEIDTGAQTAYINSALDSSALSMLDFNATTWFHLQPGLSLVRYNPISGVVAGAVAVIDYRPRWV
jgi:hypothetical protein